MLVFFFCFSVALAAPKQHTTTSYKGQEGRKLHKKVWTTRPVFQTLEYKMQRVSLISLRCRAHGTNRRVKTYISEHDTIMSITFTS